MPIKGRYILDRQIADFMIFLKEQNDITAIDINSDLELDYGSFSLSGIRIESKGFIYPAALGFDVGCGVGVFRMQNFTSEKLEKLKLSSKSIFGIRRKRTNAEISKEENQLSEFQEAMNRTYYGEIEKGNHFLEIQKNNSDEYFIIVHSGLPKRLKEKFEIIFIDFYQKYAKTNQDGCNGYIVKVPSEGEDGKIFFKVCEKANEWCKNNRNYIATAIGKTMGCGMDCFSDTSHEFLLDCDGIMVHSNGVQKLMSHKGIKKGIIISGGGCNNYLVYGKKDCSFINHGTRMKKRTSDGKRIYGEVEELTGNPDFSKKLEIADILTPILNCKRVGREYEYTIF